MNIVTGAGVGAYELRSFLEFPKKFVLNDPVVGYLTRRIRTSRIRRENEVIITSVRKLELYNSAFLESIYYQANYRGLGLCWHEISLYLCQRFHEINPLSLPTAVVVATKPVVYLGKKYLFLLSYSTYMGYRFSVCEAEKRFDPGCLFAFVGTIGTSREFEKMKV